MNYVDEVLEEIKKKNIHYRRNRQWKNISGLCVWNGGM